MAAERAPRKLAAIVCIDIAGYSALAEASQERAANCVARLRERASEVSAAHAGRIFSTAGDGAMLEFTTASDAVAAAIALCETERDPPLRLGVHMGEVMIAENGDLLGHGVNIAARLQAEATNGTILVSQIVRDTVHAALAERLSARGRVKLAKMRETMSVFGWSPADAAPLDARAAPVLAVLPFDNLSRDTDTRFFSDGVSEEILYSVSRVAGLKVIGSTSSFAFRGRDKQRAAKVLSATHVLDGSVRRSGERVRIAAQLSEAATGVVVWSERYDRELADAFALQEEIAGEVAGALTLALSGARRARPTKMTAALFDAYLRAREDLKSGAISRTTDAVAALESIVAEIDNFARGWSALAVARVEIARVARADRAALFAAAREAAQRAIGIDQEIGEAYAVLAALESELGRWREREALLERALAAEPNNPFLLFRHGQFLVSVGRVADGYAQQARAFELDPLDPTLAAFHGYNIWARRSKEDGRALLNEAAARYPDNVALWYMRLSLAALDGDFATANALREEGARLVPGLEESPILKSGRMMQDMLAAPSPEAFVKLGEDFSAMAEAQPSATLDLAVALSVLGLTQPAFALFEEALDHIDAWRQDAPDASRPHIGYETALLFIEATFSLRMNTEFVRLCARLGLVHYWAETSLWPDCVSDVAHMYDFKAECLRLV
jgi:adenylate cyclase